MGIKNEEPEDKVIFDSLDNHLVFKDDPIEKNDYSSKRLNYNIEECDISAYEELMNVLYDESERMKIEWAIGAVLSGDSVNIQKFLVLYGDKGTGKSTVLNIIQLLFDGYFAVFDAKALGSGKDFALEPLKNNPLVAIQHDGDLSRIEDNTLLNSIVSHEIMTVNEKFKPTYSMRFNSFLFMGTNRPVKITDSKSGILRRLIDVSPTGNKVTIFKYKTLMKDIKFELGGIAKHCLDIYEANKNLYDNYVPTAMMAKGVKVEQTDPCACHDCVYKENNPYKEPCGTCLSPLNDKNFYIKEGSAVIPNVARKEAGLEPKTDNPATLDDILKELKLIKDRLDIYFSCDYDEKTEDI